MNVSTGNAKIIDVPGGRIAYEVSGEGPLVVLAHGMGDNRSAYRFLAPLLVAAGYRVAPVDLRGHGSRAPAGPPTTTPTSPGTCWRLSRPRAARR